MKNKFAILALFFVVALAGNAAAQSVSYEVVEVSQLTVAGSPTLTINNTNSGAGSGLLSVTGIGTYDITTNATNKKITAALDLAMASDVALTVAFTAPTVGTSAGAVALTAVAQDVVTGITEVDETAIPISYTLSADVTAGIVASTTRTLTYTLIDSGI